jgi:hypothetical protein
MCITIQRYGGCHQSICISHLSRVAEWEDGWIAVSPTESQVCATALIGQANAGPQVHEQMTLPCRRAGLRLNPTSPLEGRGAHAAAVLRLRYEPLNISYKYA